MSEGTYALSFSTMDVAIQEARVVADKFRSSLEEMNANLNTSLASWTGPAQDSYTATYSQIYKTAQEMPDALNVVEQVLAQIREEYSNSESHVMRAFG